MYCICQQAGCTESPPEVPPSLSTGAFMHKIEDIFIGFLVAKMWDQQVQRRVSGVFMVGVDGINKSIEGVFEIALGVVIVGIDGIKRIGRAPQIQGHKYL